MTDAVVTGILTPGHSRDAAERRLRKRRAAETRFRVYGIVAIAFAIAFLAILLVRIGLQAHTAFTTHNISTEVYLDPARIDRADLLGSNYDIMVADQLVARLGLADPTGEKGLKMQELLSAEMGFRILDRVRENPALIGQRITIAAPISANADLYYKDEITRAVPEDERRIDNEQMGWLDQLEERGVVKGAFNTGIFTNSDSTQPEVAGLLGATVGSALMLLVTGFLAVPIGVLAAIYLEEFAPKNPLTEVIEVNINNLAAVPSIVYGLLGLAVFINWLHLPRASPLVGGLVLALMALPTVIIATRSSLKAVPPSIREAALGVGASRTQAVFHHVLPLAMPGVMTGTIISLAHALGETAPLLMIGMVSFVPGVPEGFTSASTVLPVQIFIWENASERAFHERTAAAILVLLGFMIVMNATAILLRRRFERRW
jgi:phosphate transport system permease protein